jgi:UDP-N-acetylglucosamine 1-carboxyvinyltransferase
MQKIVIEGGRSLKGTVTISGAKNAALPCLFASLLTDQACQLRRVPKLRDVNTTIRLLEHLGAVIKAGKKIDVNPKAVRHYRAPYEMVKTMRASILCLGPLLARFGKAEVSLPGGCAIGARPVNLHLAALEQMGAKIDIQGGYIHARAKKLHGAKITFDQVTVTGTENIMMAACLARGETVLKNAAREPEVVDLAMMLHAMGVPIEGAGSDTIFIQGVSSLNGTQHHVIPDRIEMGTFMIAAAMTRGDVIIEDGDIEYVEALSEKLREMGANVTTVAKGLRVKGASKIYPLDVTTLPYPGFATDFQAQFMALMCLAQGTSVIVEDIFENRFLHVAELVRMGADIKTEGRTAIINGVPSLSGAPVMASDLRASAALILAGLAAKGLTEVHRIYHLDRGYEKIEVKLRKLGARIKRAKVKF